MNKIMSREDASAYLQHGDEFIQRLAASYINVVTAIEQVYYAAQWTADRQVDEAALWTAVRDAAGFPSGFSPAITELGLEMRKLKGE